MVSDPVSDDSSSSENSSLSEGSSVGWYAEDAAMKRKSRGRGRPAQQLSRLYRRRGYPLKQRLLQLPLDQAARKERTIGFKGLVLALLMMNV